MASMLQLTATEQSVVDKVKAFKAKHPVPSVANGDEIIEIIKDGCMAELRTYALDEIAIHPQNRNFVGVEPADMQALVHKITNKAVGWSWNEFRNPRSFQRCPGESGQQQLKENKRMADQTDGQLAPCSDRIRILTVTCTHTMAGVRAVRFRANRG